MSSDAWIGRTLGGRYRLTSSLGAGGMGAVYRAIQDPLGREVAVKVLNARLDHDAEARARFEGEARVLAKLSHANIVVLHDFGHTDEGELFLVMESVPGQPLRDLMQSHGAIAWPRAVRLAAQIARGLRAAHAAGVIHADLKPENVMLHRPAGEDEQAKLLDFGLARFTQQAGPGVTEVGVIVGTPRYLSPERIKGVRDDPRSDLYALGVMLFEMLAGHAPFEAASPAMVLVQHMSEAARAPSADGALVPAALDDLVLHLMAKAPEDRPPDAGSVVDLLESLLEGEASFATSATIEGEAVSALGSVEGVQLSWPPTDSGAPTGRVTLVFTDIEGSSSLWDAMPTTMRDALLVHDQVMRATLAVSGGYEVKTQGDSFMVTFSSPDLAVRWCLDAQEALLAAPWPAALLDVEGCKERKSADGTVLHRGLRVRMGAFEGVPDCRPDPLTGRMDYFGPVVNRAARVEAAAHGGQVIVGGHIAHALDSLLGNDVIGRDLGDHHLKGIEGTERLKEVVSPRLAERTFPPPRTIQDDAPKTNLGREQSSFIGRADDLVRLETAFAGATLVTLLGPGGTGKTRLSRRYGEQHVERFSGGVWFADLTSATTGVGVVTALADALGLQQLGGETFDDSVDLLGGLLHDRGPCLVIFDNFEQVVGHAVDTLAVWRARAPDARFLVTSRIPLQLEGEAVMELEPFAADVGIELFLERCQRKLNADELDAVREIVVALDGMPLAIELAAARARVLSPRQIVARLGKRLDFLKESRRDRTSRQTNLRGAMDWSWDLLDETERAAFAQCGVFEGGFSLESAESVLALGDPDADVLDVVQSLKEKSLLRAIPTPDGDVRFAMYQTIRAYADEKLSEREDAEATRVRHAEHFVLHAERAARGVAGSSSRESLVYLAAERENLLAVARRFDTHARSPLAVRALVALERLIHWRGPFQGRVDMLRRALRIAEAANARSEELSVRLALGRFFALEGDTEIARTTLEPAVKLAQELSDDTSLVTAVALLIRAAGRRADPEHEPPGYDLAVERLLDADISARAVFEQAIGMRALGAGRLIDASNHGRVALGLARQAGDRSLEARILSNLGIISIIRADMDGAIDFYERALLIVRDLGERPVEGLVLGNLGTAEFTRGANDRALDFLERAVFIHREVGNGLLLASDNMNLAMIRFELGEPDPAQVLLEESLGFFEARGGMVRELTTAVTGLLFIAADRGDLAVVRALHERLAKFRKLFTGLVYFAGDVASLIDGRAALAEAVALPADDPAGRGLVAEAVRHYETARTTKVYYLHAHVRWLRRALRDAGVELGDALRATA